MIRRRLMKSEKQLIKELTEIIKDTSKGKVKWKVQGQTTEYNELYLKPTVVEDGITWVVDECYICFECKYKGEDFVLITYEMIHTSDQQKKTTNLVFLPPLGVRYFDLRTLLPYSIEASQILTFEIHNLWMMLLDMYKKDPQSVEFDMGPRELTIE